MPAQFLKLLSAAASETPDAELLARFRDSRDDAAFNELVRRHGSLVWRICRRLCGPSSADDAFQATFLILACRADSVRKAASLGSWLVSVAGRVARQTRKRDQRMQAVPANLNQIALSENTNRAPELDDLATILDEEITRLPDHLRDPLVLCLIQGRTQEQAAASIGGSVRTIRRRLDRAKAVLQARLERRGVIPAVAAASIVSLGAATGAAAPELIHRTVNDAIQFLTVGASTPAVILAKGIVMGTAKLKLAGVAAAASIVFGLGFGLASDPAKPAPMKPALGDIIVPPAVAGSVEPPPTPQAVTPRVYAAHSTANFHVYAVSHTQARMVAGEAEYLRKELSKTWCGAELPDWPTPCTILMSPSSKTVGSGTRFTFQPKTDNTPAAVKTAHMTLNGPFLTVVEEMLPDEILRCVLTTQLRKQLPRWVDKGFPLLLNPDFAQAYNDGRARQALNEGRAIRLKRLFTMDKESNSPEGIFAQSHSVARFLKMRKSKLPSDSKEEALVQFLTIARDENWDAAVKRVYGFESVDALEIAWVEWMKKPESQLSGGPIPLPMRPTPPDLIPPTKVPSGR